MLPVILSIGKLSISSFGFFLALSFLLSTFLVWRLARAWDLNEEKILDLVLLTFFGSLLGARLFFVSLNFEYFAVSFSRVFLLTSSPGLSFWGGLLGGWLTLWVFTKRFKLDFLQIADLASIGLLGGLVLGDIGCFLGGCGIGIPSQFLGVNMAGVVGKRFPIQIIEAVVFLLTLRNFWPRSLKFHSPGKILSISLIAIGVTKLFTNFFRTGGLDNHILALSTAILGFFIYFRISKKPFKRTLFEIIDNFREFLKNLKNNKLTLVEVQRTWYNQKSRVQSTLRRLRVRPTPKNF